MNTNIKAIIANKGYQSLIPSIEQTIRDLKRLDYTKAEIKETLRDSFFGADERLDAFIVSLGY